MTMSTITINNATIRVSVYIYIYIYILGTRGVEPQSTASKRAVAIQWQSIPVFALFFRPLVVGISLLIYQFL